jgi:hypothetical protein
MGTPRGWSSSFMLRNSDAARTRANLRLELDGNEDGGSGMELSADLTFRPATRWQLTISPTVEREINDQQYVATLDQGPASTFGRRYVFAFVDQTTLSSEIRLNYAFAPDINLEFYGEPFAASGRYYDFGQLVATGSRERLPFATPGGSQPGSNVLLTDGASTFTVRNRDFNVLSFRSNLVLRWEWRPGSTLYLVWQQDREESEIARTRVGLRDVFGAFGAAGHNVLAVKTTFWFGGF